MKTLALIFGILICHASDVVAQTAPSPDEISNYTGLHAAAAKGDTQLDDLQAQLKQMQQQIDKLTGGKN